MKITILDRYIFKKFFSTYFFSILALAVIIIVFDISERIDDFVAKKVPLTEIAFSFYGTFIPFLVIKFSALFTFIAVIFFTSKLAAHTEIVAILSNGISFGRIMRSYIMVAIVIAGINFALDNFLLPAGSKIRYEFTEKYLRFSSYQNNERNIHRQTAPNVFAYMSQFDTRTQTGYRFTLEHFSKDTLLSKTTAEMINWDTIREVWVLHNYNIRTFVKQKNIDTIESGTTKDTVMNFTGKDLSIRANTFIETMDYFELEEYIRQLNLQGAKTVYVAYIEKHKRIAYPLANIILAIIGLTLSSRKVRGGTGIYLGIGVALSFAYLLLQRFSEMFVQANVLPAYIALWLPNILYIFIAIYLYRKTPK